LPPLRDIGAHAAFSQSRQQLIVVIPESGVKMGW
jgi:hypothetical protein